MKKYGFGVDIGGTTIKMGFFETSGKLLDKWEIKTDTENGGKNILSDVAQRETTVLISSHNLRELEDICDHVGIMDHGKMLLERSLADMQGSTVKLQLVGDAPKELEILHESQSGRLKTLVVRGSAEEVAAKVQAAGPVYFDVLPLSLEEIFIYELGGVNYEVKNIVL